MILGFVYVITVEGAARQLKLNLMKNYVREVSCCEEVLKKIFDEGSLISTFKHVFRRELDDDMGDSSAIIFFKT